MDTPTYSFRQGEYRKNGKPIDVLETLAEQRGTLEAMQRLLEEAVEMYEVWTPGDPLNYAYRQPALTREWYVEAKKLITQTA
jgi:hypothetical protein